MHVGFIGLGQMGAPMAENILKAGHKLTIYNRTAEKAQFLVDQGGQLAATPLEAAQSEVLLTMVTDDAAIHQLFFEQGLIEDMPVDTIHASCSTISAACGNRLREAHKQKGRPFVGSPVLGRPEKAAEAMLFSLASGSKINVERCLPVFQAFSQQQFYLGEDPCAAIVAKVANNFLLGCVIESMAEAYTICDANGLDRSDFLNVITSTIFGAPIYDIYGGMMARKEFLPPSCPPAIGIKDMQLALDAAASSGHDMPLARLVADHLLAAVEKGFENHDWSVLGSEENKWRLG